MAWLSTMCEETWFQQAAGQRPVPPFSSAQGKPPGSQPGTLPHFLPGLPVSSCARVNGWEVAAYILHRRGHPSPETELPIPRAPATRVQAPLCPHNRSVAARPWKSSRTDSQMLWSLWYFLARRWEDSLTTTTTTKGGGRKLYYRENPEKIPAICLILSLPERSLSLTHGPLSARDHTRFPLPAYIPRPCVSYTRKVRQRGP